MKRLVVLIACLLCACTKPEPTPTPTPAASTTPVAATSVSAPPAWKPPPTGVLSEEDFKKLHELKTEAAPPREGKLIEIEGTRAYLSGAKPGQPAVIVIHEWWGLNEHVMHFADRIAREGYTALAVDLYGGTIAKNSDEAMKAMKAVDDKVAREKLLQAYAYAKTELRAEKRGVIGWCFGGKWSLELALAAPDLDAAVVYYGHVTTDKQELAKLKAPLFGVFGNLDKGIPPSMVDQFEKSLKENKAKFTIERYDAEHAFANPSNPRYDQKSAETAWTHVRAFLAENLKGKQP